MSTPYWGQLPGPKIHRRLSESESGDAPAVLEADDAHRRRPPPASDSTPTTASGNRQNQIPDSNSQSDDSNPSAHLDPSPIAARGSGPTVAPDAAQPQQAPQSTHSPQELPQRRRSKRLQKLPHQVPKMTNRSSVQTSVTDSTYNYDEPETPSFQPQGLAPRPPSYIRSGAPGQQGSTGMQHSSSRRRSRQPDDYDDFATSTPPAAPEVPKGPPTSYRAPYGNGGAYQDTASGGAGTGASGLPEEYYARGVDPGAASRSHPGVTDVPLNVSAGGTSDRRKVFADDRSPLQRLELTLGSYTKEEKRARVEAAERRARERAALRAGVTAPTTTTQDVAPERRVSSGRHDTQTSRHVAPQFSSTAAATVAPVAAPVLAQHEDVSRDDARRRGSHRRSQPSQSYGPREVTSTNVNKPLDSEHYDDAQASGVPTRNLSFRERAAKDHTELPGPPQEPVYGQQAQASTSGGLSLSRSGSNKLRKHPPGDPWYHQRMEAERAIPSVATRIPQSSQRPARREQIPQTSEDDRLPMNPPTDVRGHGQDASNRNGKALGAGAVAAGALGAAAAAGSRSASQRQPQEPMSPGYDSDEKYMPTKTKRKDLSHWGYEPPESQRPPPGVEAARRQLEGEDSSRSSDESLRHEQEAAAYGHPEQMSPGKGRYQPPEWLNEWEKATVGTLTGQLLDLTAQADPEADLEKNKAWWEGGGGSRRNSSSHRPRRAEAFDGEYDESSGKS